MHNTEPRRTYFCSIFLIQKKVILKNYSFIGKNKLFFESNCSILFRKAQSTFVSGGVDRLNEYACLIAAAIEEEVYLIGS